MINLKMVVLRRTVIVKVVSVPIAVNVVIGTLRAILKPGNGCAITKIGNRQIGSVTVIIVFMSISNVVMVPLVFFILIMIIFMVMLFMIIIVSVKTMFVLSYAYEIPLFVRVCAISC